MRIVHLGKYYHPHAGGIETHVRTLAQEQAKCGAEIQVVCISHNHRLPASEWDGQVYVRRFFPKFTFAKFDWLPEVTRYLDEIPCDVLHIHVPNPSMALSALRMRSLPPLVIGFHSDIVGMHLRRWIFQPIAGRLFRRSMAIGITHSSMLTGTTALHPYQDRVRIIPYGLPLNELLTPTDSMRERALHIRTESAGPLWLMCGRLVPYKGHAIGIHALTRAPGKLIIIGDGPLRDSLTALVRDLRLSDRVEFLGNLSTEDVRAYYRAATALWFPSISRSEAFGLVQVEAMASGCPVINTDIPGSAVPWVSLHEESGLTVPVNDPDSLALAAQRLLDNPDLHDHLGSQAIQRALALFDQSVMTERWSAVYDQIHRPRKSQQTWIPVQ